jgi:putative copper export protein
VQTVDGRFAVYRLILGLVFGIYFFAVRKRIYGARTFTMHEGVLAAVMTIVLIDRARVSHAAASHFHPDFSILMNAVHLLAKEFWVGGLIALSLILMPTIVRIGRASWMAVTLTTMSKYISASLAVTAITGAYIVWLHLKSPAYILTTPWGRRFIVLSAVASVLVLIRMYNQLFAERYAVVSCLKPVTGYRREAVRWLQFSIPFEMCVGVALLFVTSYLIITTPPYPAERYALEKHAESQGANISLTVHPVEQKQFLVTVTNLESGAAESVTDLVVTLENMEKNIGPIVAETDERFKGGFTFPRNSLSVPGPWKIDITARRNGAYDAAVSIPMNYPAEFEASRINPDVRVPGPFEAILASVALIATVVSMALYRFDANLAGQCEIEDSHNWNAPGFRVSKSLLAGASATAAICTVIWLSDVLFIKSSFQRLCEDHGGSWTQSVPMRGGVTLSSETMAVCSTPSNDFRFAEAREFEFSLQKNPEHEHHHH